MLVIKEEPHHPTPAHRPRAEPAAKKSKAPPKPPQDPDAVFPCKKCGRYGHVGRDLLCSHLFLITGGEPVSLHCCGY